MEQPIKLLGVVGVKGVYSPYLMIILRLFFVFLDKNICCWYALDSPRRGDSNEYQENYPKIIINYPRAVGHKMMLMDTIIVTSQNDNTC